jgi:gliding motility-associated-like protein
VNLDHRPELIFTRTGSLLSVMENLITPTTLTFTTQPATATLCDVMDADLTVAATGDNNVQYKWQKLNTISGKFEDVLDDATYEGINSQTLEISYPPLIDTYRAVVQGDYSLAISASAVLTVSSTPTAPTVTGDTECSGSAVSLSASGGANGNYRWYTAASGGTAISGEVNSGYVTPVLTSTTSYFAVLDNNGCESSRSEVIATLNVVPPPTATNGIRCDPGVVTVSGAGGSNGQYRWYDVVSGGTAISGEVNSTFTTPSITSTTSYFVSINDGLCESVRAEAVATINSTPSAPTPINNARCDNGQVSLGASGGTNGNYRWYLTSSSVSPLAGEINNSFITPSITTTSSFFVSHIISGCESLRTEVFATIGSVLPPVTNTEIVCNNTPATLTASGGVDGQYKWYPSAVGGTAISGAVNAAFTTPGLTSTTSYFVSIVNGVCESERSEAIASVTFVASPTTTAAARCGNGTVTLSASGGSDGNYRWYDVAAVGTSIAGAVNSSFTTPSLSATSTYYVAITDGTCEGPRTPVVATVNTPPGKPAITPSVSSSGTTVTICSGSVNLSAPAGFTYLWSTGATTQQITVSSAGTFTVQVSDANTCSSVSSDAIQVVIDPAACNNPPVIAAEELTAQIEGSVSLDLATIISDPDNNIDLSSITIVTQPQSGAVATISNGQLQLDYSGVSFSGTDVVTIRVCDLAGSCTTENLTIEVIGDIEVFNAVSPNGDGLNEFLRIQYIELLARTRSNKVTILNRWGDKVFEIANYDNNTRVFRGLNTNGTELPSGTYYYKIEFTGQDVPPMKTGYLTLKR